VRRNQYGNPDRNQRLIIDALEKVGAEVTITSGVGGGCGDLLVGFRDLLHALEVKRPESPELNANEVAWHRRYRRVAKRCVHVVTTPEEALRAIGATP
jgi:hypothetical protein